MTNATIHDERSAPPRHIHPEMLALRRRALDWLETMAAAPGPGDYRLHARAEPTIFASCFAVFLRHLLGDLDRLTANERSLWLTALQRHQDPASGLFVDPGNTDRARDELHDATHLNQQLTTFCLGAVHALGGRPRHRLAFVDEWSADRVRGWLDGLDWSEPWNCGNKAMFLGICLAYDAEHGGGAQVRESLDAWFAWHDAHQNPRSGFWGEGLRAGYMEGLGGAYHQFTVYNYVGRPIQYADRIVDRALLVQCHDGMYSSYLGGATCYELDAVDVLVHLYARRDYRRAEIRDALRRVLPGVLSMQNPDGGFCWGRYRPYTVSDAVRLVADTARHRSAAQLYLGARAAMATRVKPRPVIRTGWAKAGRDWCDSSVFDTWFRLVTIAEISKVLADVPYATYPWQFLTVPGLGWFPAEFTICRT